MPIGSDIPPMLSAIEALVVTARRSHDHTGRKADERAANELMYAAEHLRAADHALASMRAEEAAAEAKAAKGRKVFG